jgi:16S rRNA (cytosine967-C5)-methyltransferase
MSEPFPSLPLWQLLQSVAGVLGEVRSGASATAALERIGAPLRPGVQSLSFSVLRSLGRAEALRSLLVPRKPPPAADALLCAALALVWQESQAPYDVFTLVNQAVEAAKRSAGTQAQAGFINACLRRFLRERDALVRRSDQDLVAVWNHPAWWIKRLQQDHPKHWQEILLAGQSHAPMSLRVNVRKTSRDDYLERLKAAGIEARAQGESGLTLAKPVPVQALPGFDEGWVSVQDPAAQLAAPLLVQAWKPDHSHRVLDACAAPGGKTAHLLEITSAQVTALEIDGKRSERIVQTLERLQLKAKVLIGDAAQPASWWDGQLFDAILLDAPCTASGIVRRHPDIVWLRRESDVAQLVTLQARLLKALWKLLKPGGRLLYCTCSVFRAEGEGQIQTFLGHNTPARLLPSPGHLLPNITVNPEAVTDNQLIDHDGFYYALLEKSTGAA